MVVTWFTNKMLVNQRKLNVTATWIRSFRNTNLTLSVQARGQLAAPSWNATSGAATKEAENHLLATSLMSQESRAPRHSRNPSILVGTDNSSIEAGSAALVSLHMLHSRRAEDILIENTWWINTWNDHPFKQKLSVIYTRHSTQEDGKHWGKKLISTLQKV